MKITTARRLAQIFFFLLFVWLIWSATFERLQGYPVSVFHEYNPLIAITTALATHSLHRALVGAMLVLAATMLLGRVFCGWVCPIGALHQLTGWLFGPGNNLFSRVWNRLLGRSVQSGASVRLKMAANRYRSLFTLKYYLLIFLLVSALFGSIQVGWLDPLCLFARSLSLALFPFFDWFSGWDQVTPRVFSGSYWFGAIVLALLAANAVIPRFFCRVLCPLGALLGIFSWFAWWRVERMPKACTNCGLCQQSCEGACEPHSTLRMSECLVCCNCLDDCPHQAMEYVFLGHRETIRTTPELEPRRSFLAAVTGFLFFPLAQSSGEQKQTYSPQAIRPPGALEERRFLARCVKCGQCMRVCPTNVLQPAWGEAGLEGVWTPVLNMRVGYCELNCTLCGQVCPTGAIQPIPIERKLGLGQWQGQKIKLGTAFYDRGRCFPWAMHKPCVVCQEVCPVSPKAIFTKPTLTTNNRGQSVQLALPYVDPARCIGCGICSHECPVSDRPAIYVTAVGESRSRQRSLLLEQNAD